jgi:hypothetical protein
MTTPLSKIGKKAWSASSINKLMAQPASWVLSYIYGCYGSGSPAMTRGLATEVGYNHYIKSEFGDLDSAVAEATRYFNKNTALQGLDEAKRDKECDSLRGFIEQTINAFEPFGFPTSTQNALELKLEGVIDPFIGYDDYNFPPMADMYDGKPLCVDLKTTHRVPSQMSDSHARQMALYQKMKPDHQILITYVSPKKSATYEMTHELADELIVQITRAAQSAEKMLDIFDDPKDIATLFSPDYSSSFYWNDPVTLAEARKVWGY